MKKEDKNKQEVTIQQLKEILQPMDNKEFDLSMCRVQVDNEEQAKKIQELAFKQGFKWGASSKNYQYLNSECFYFNTKDYKITFSDLSYTEDEYSNFHFNDIFKYSLEQQLEKAKAEVKRIEEEIEESKIKIGDWVISELNECIFKYQYGRVEYDLTKITDQELINKLNNLIK